MARLFVKGGAPGPGRPRGAKDKIPRTIRAVLLRLEDMMIRAEDRALEDPELTLMRLKARAGIVDPAAPLAPPAGGKKKTAPPRTRLMNLFEWALLRGLMAPPPHSATYLQMVMAYRLGRPPDFQEEPDKVPRVLFLLSRGAPGEFDPMTQHRPHPALIQGGEAKRVETKPLPPAPPPAAHAKTPPVPPPPPEPAGAGDDTDDMVVL